MRRSCDSFHLRSHDRARGRRPGTGVGWYGVRGRSDARATREGQEGVRRRQEGLRCWRLPGGRAEVQGVVQPLQEARAALQHRARERVGRAGRHRAVLLPQVPLRRAGGRAAAGRGHRPREDAREEVPDRAHHDRPDHDWPVHDRPHRADRAGTHRTDRDQAGRHVQRDRLPAPGLRRSRRRRSRSTSPRSFPRTRAGP